MQMTNLPVATCELIDKRIRAFIWGAKLGERKLHLVNWDIVCLPKRMGGLGIRSARELNGAYMMKLAWSLLKHPNELWVQVLTTKYMKKVNGSLVARGSKRLSPLWRGISAAWEPMNRGLQWGINNGNDTSFWLDRWLDCGVVLRDQALPNAGVNWSEKVAGFTLPLGDWDLHKLSSVLSTELVKEVMGMTPPSPNLGQDLPVWGLEENGGFSIKSAYSIMRNDREMEGDRVWKLAWSWPGPNRIRSFLWLAVRGRILTNGERRRRHLSTEGGCKRCGRDEEDVLHVLRDCPFAISV
ncbi:Putative ribonuclease H protein At1g65750 [Linum perenne]